MAPKSWPDEVDVFTIPHSRMKELVQKYLNMVSDINFTNVGHLTSLLENLCNTFKEFHNHEQVENQFIMNKLKEKLKCLSIKNHAVCNCHSDNRLTEMLNLFQDGYKCTEKTDADRVNYGIKLRTALEDFTNNFLPHMEEEEEIFQPMLIKYFSYDELCDIKNEVLIHHSISTGQKEAKLEEEELICDEFHEKEEWEKSEKEVEYKGIDTLPEELMLKVFSHLDPRQLCRCAQVSQRWNALSIDGSLWKTILPVQWSMGQWSFVPKLDCDLEEEKVNINKELMTDVLSDEMVDEDADRDESGGDESDNNVDDECMEDKQIRKEAAMLTSLVKYLLPRVGSYVKSCYLGYSKGLVNGLLYKLLSQCPNMEILDLSQTRISDIAFKGLGRKGCGSKLRHLNLGGCFNITDRTLERLSSAFGDFSYNERSVMFASKLEKNETEDNEKDQSKIDKCEKCHILKQGKDTNVNGIKKSTTREKVTEQECMGYESKVDMGKDVSSQIEAAVDASVYDSCDYSNLKKHHASNFENVSNKSILPYFEESYLLENLTDQNVGQALERACDYLENMMKKSQDVFDKPKTLKESFQRLGDKENCNTSDVSDAQCLNYVAIAGHGTDLVGEVYHNDSTEYCDQCNMSAKHLTEADDICSHSCQTTIKFYESKKPKRTTCVSFDHQNTNKLQSGSMGTQDSKVTRETGDSLKICDNDLDLNGEVLNSDPNSRYLEYLSLSGCYHITDSGLRCLAEGGGLPHLRYLDLSGCLNITADGLTELVSVCPALDGEELYYCDNVIDGPYAAEASGCQNLECNSRVCCRSGY